MEGTAASAKERLDFGGVGLGMANTRSDLVSVIIPTLNEAACLPKLLDALAAEPASPEVIVADGGSTDGTVELARSAGARVVETARGRGCQMNAAAQTARGGVWLFLHADTIPESGAVAELPPLLQASGGDFGAFRLKFEPAVWLPQALAMLTAFAKHWTCFGDQGIFVRKEFFYETGGFPEIPILEDVHWLRRAASMGRMVRSPKTVVTSSRRFKRAGMVRQSFRNLEVLLRDRLGDKPGRLASIYHGGRSSPSVSTAQALGLLRGGEFSRRDQRF